ncbi:acyl-CoA synthetase (AMP-forming)/AMP-acid ligase II [Nocardia kruczakiae]|uniref:Acyl-CoA synthetase (AMP-forming)/AMP-acid ligase II n=1 Tax=Nocardia kruczakiae TaxID=261477 RepID=A0ABU1X714_9NOCA|nr:fatty acid--CoA ligase family protein [Nocardia kruczakiae]MDR7166342.1 acyl-CoA synthetase (AMP-forming)/AMP-acid ligase II [Nocardia kruczakiae]
MNISMILEMAASAGNRPVITVDGRSLTAAQLLRLARRAAADFADSSAVLYLGANHLAYPVALFGAVLAAVPFVPLNYRLGEHQLSALLARHPGARVLRPEDLDALVETDAAQPDPKPRPAPWDGAAVAAIIYTSGTTSEPKAALLRHRHLMAYLLNTMEFGAAAESDGALVSVPPYHIAGLTNLLSNLYSGRRVVYLPAFDPQRWLDTVRAERITHAMLVPTMLARIVTAADGATADTPTLASLAYGGSRMPRPVLERALAMFPGTGFVNAYGLTETASSVAVLGPEDHRAALAATDPAIRERLGSVGRALPGLEFDIRSAAGESLPIGQTGLVFVRGEQISGEYGARTALDADGWFGTRDLGRLDDDGYLFIEGRADDTIIRGGENIAPAEIEDVLLTHPGISEAAVIGVPDPEWGQRLVAVVVGAGDPEEIKRWVRERMRSSKTPDAIVFRAELPKTETGKLLRRNLVAELESSHA